MKFHRRRVRLAGITLTSGAWHTDDYHYRFELVHDAHPLTSAFTTTDYKIVREYFPKLPATEQEAKKRGLIVENCTDHAKAVFFESLNQHSGREHNTFCGRNSYGIAARRLDGSSVSIRWTSGRYSINETDVSSWISYADTFGVYPSVERAMILRSSDQT